MCVILTLRGTCVVLSSGWATYVPSSYASSLSALIAQRPRRSTQPASRRAVAQDRPQKLLTVVVAASRRFRLSPTTYYYSHAMVFVRDWFPVSCRSPSSLKFGHLPSLVGTVPYRARCLPQRRPLAIWRLVWCLSAPPVSLSGRKIKTRPPSPIISTSLALGHCG